MVSVQYELIIYTFCGFISVFKVFVLFTGSGLLQCVSEEYVSGVSEQLGTSVFSVVVSEDRLSRVRRGGKEGASPRSAPMKRVNKECNRRPL